MHTMRRPLAILLAVSACAAASGCLGNSHRVEAELRKREIEVRELREELHQCEAYNAALQMDLHGGPGEFLGPVPPHGPGPAFPIRSLTLGRQTGGRELNGSSCDDALQVVLEPRDAEGQAIKVPNAAAVIQLIEIAADGLKRPLSVWEIPPEQLRNHWRAGLLTTGYVLVLPWKEPPTTEKVRVVALLRLPDGRAFEADKDVTIRVSGKRRMPPPDPPAADGPLLPAPRLLDQAQPGAGRDPKPAAPLAARKTWWDVSMKPPSDPPAAIGRPTPLP
jgi:hypothetical protein